MTPLHKSYQREASHPVVPSLPVITPNTPPRSSTTVTAMMRQRNSKEDVEIICILTSSDDEDDDDEDENLESPAIVTGKKSDDVVDGTSKLARKSLDKEFDERQQKQQQQQQQQPLPQAQALPQPQIPSNVVVTATSNDRTVISPTRSARCEGSSMISQPPGSPTFYVRSKTTSPPLSISSPTRKFIKSNHEMNKNRMDYSARVAARNQSSTSDAVITTATTSATTTANDNVSQTNVAGTQPEIKKRAARKTLAAQQMNEKAMNNQMNGIDTVFKDCPPGVMQPPLNRLALLENGMPKHFSLDRRDMSGASEVSIVSQALLSLQKSTTAATADEPLEKEASISTTDTIHEPPSISSRIEGTHAPADIVQFLNEKNPPPNESNLFFPPPTILNDKLKHVYQRTRRGRVETSTHTNPNTADIPHNKKQQVPSERSNIVRSSKSKNSQSHQNASLSTIPDCSHVDLRTDIPESDEATLQNTPASPLLVNRSTLSVAQTPTTSNTNTSKVQLQQTQFPNSATTNGNNEPMEAVHTAPGRNGNNQVSKSTDNMPEVYPDMETPILCDDMGRSLSSTQQTDASSINSESNSLSHSDAVGSNSMNSTATGNRKKRGRPKSAKKVTTAAAQEHQDCTSTTEQENKDSTSEEPRTKDGQDMKVWRETILPLLQFCGKCVQCQLKPCGLCRLCTIVSVVSVSARQNAANVNEGSQNKRMKTSRRFCLFNCCSKCDDDVMAKLTKSSKRNRTSLTSSVATNSRINQLCDRQKVYQWYRNELCLAISRVEKERDAPQSEDSYLFDINSPVFCFWPASKTYFEAVITKRFLGYSGSFKDAYRPFYSVHFTDGSDDRRTRVPEKDILTVFQMNLLLEADRIDDKLKECSLLSESLFATSNSEKLKGLQTSSRTESELTNDTPDTVSDVIDASIDGTYSIDEFTFHSDISISSPTVPDDRTMPNKRMWSSDQNLPESDSMDSDMNDKVKYSFRSKSCKRIQTHCTPDEVTSGLAHQILDQNQDHKKKTSFKTRVYSNSKRVGSRCYARWPGNGSFFWGFITKAIGYGPHRKYSIRFDDGDECDDVRPEHVYSEAEYRKIERKEPPNVIGHRSDVLQNHPLYGLGFCRKWIDISGFTRTTFGKIGECVEAFDDPTSPLFEIHYHDDKIGNTVHDVSPQMKIDYVPEHVAWAGHLMYLATIEPTSRPTPQNLPFYVQWIVPDRRLYNFAGHLFLETRGFRLQMTAEQSSIPGAGLGLFLRVSDMSGSGRTHFVLKQGELLCIGPYGPFNANDRKSTAVFETKSFIHEYEPESYCFESYFDNKSFYVDITNDNDGQLHDDAKKNLMCRVNEVNGGDIPCICADKDPSGSIQYYLGHNVAGYGDLRIAVECPCELKIDYGELYERQRVRFGYPRIQGEKLAAMRSSIETMDDDQVHDLSEYSPNDIHDCLQFLESLFCPTWDAVVIKKQRALILAIAFRRRITTLQASTGVIEAENPSWDGYEEMKKNRTVARAGKMVQMLCDSLGGKHEIQRVVLSYQLLEKIVTEYIFNGNESGVLMPSTDLYRRIILL